eukprot:1703093-Prymnesium_polylepis.2
MSVLAAAELVARSLSCFASAHRIAACFSPVAVVERSRLFGVIHCSVLGRSVVGYKGCRVILWTTDGSELGARRGTPLYGFFHEPPPTRP